MVLDNILFGMLGVGLGWVSMFIVLAWVMGGDN